MTWNAGRAISDRAQRTPLTTHRRHGPPGTRRRAVPFAVLVAVAAALVAVAVRPAHAKAYEDVVSAGSFNSYAALEKDWVYLYPWGSKHNGSAEMFGSPTDHSHTSVNGGTLTLRASPVAGQGAIHYQSGAIHARAHIVVDDAYPQWLVTGNFRAPTTRGTWPAFWLNGNDSWPPEIDILEFKGNDTNWFNTFNSATSVNSTQSRVPGSGTHVYTVILKKIAGTQDLSVEYYLDTRFIVAHRASNYLGRHLRLIINLQMEGSSGSPGPAGDTTFTASNVAVKRLSA